MSAYSQNKVKNLSSSIVFGSYLSNEASSYKQQYLNTTVAAQINFRNLLQSKNNFSGKQKFANKPAQRGFMEVLGFKENQVESQPIRKSRENTFVPQFNDIDATQRKMLDFYGIAVKPNSSKINDNASLEPQKRSKSAGRTATDIRKHLNVPLKAYESDNHKDIYFQSMRSQVFEDQQQIPIRKQSKLNEDKEIRRAHSNERNYSNLFGREFSKQMPHQQSSEKSDKSSSKKSEKVKKQINKEKKEQESAKETYLRSIYSIPKEGKVNIQKLVKQENERPWDKPQIEQNPVSVYQIDVSNLPQNVDETQLRKLMPKNVALVSVQSTTSNHIIRQNEVPAKITIRCASQNNNRAKDQVKENLKDVGIEIQQNAKPRDFEKIQPATTKWEQVDSSKFSSNNYEPQLQKFNLRSSVGEIMGNKQVDQIDQKRRLRKSIDETRQYQQAALSRSYLKLYDKADSERAHSRDQVGNVWKNQNGVIQNTERALSIQSSALYKGNTTSREKTIKKFKKPTIETNRVNIQFRGSPYMKYSKKR